MATLAKDIQKSSAWLVLAFKGMGKKLDYSVKSVKLIDELIDQHFIDGKPKPDGVFANGLGQKMFAIGAYLGEVVIRNTKDSRWVTNDKDPDGEITIEVVSSNGTQMWPVQKVMKRITLGREDALYPYIVGAVNEYMKTSDGAGTGKKPWWKLW